MIQNHKFLTSTSHCSGTKTPHYYCESCGHCALSACSAYAQHRDIEGPKATAPTPVAEVASYWRPVPAHRVLVVPVANLKEFMFLDANNNPCTVTAGVRAFRIKDTYWFKRPQYLEYIILGGKAVQLEPEHG